MLRFVATAQIARKNGVVRALRLNEGVIPGGCIFSRLHGELVGMGERSQCGVAILSQADQREIYMTNMYSYSR